jgi:hypothetical protein
MVVVAAVVHILIRRGHSQADIAAQFGWNVEAKDGGRRRSELVRTLATMSRKVRLKRDANGKRRFSSEWKRALAQASEYTAANP